MSALGSKLMLARAIGRVLRASGRGGGTSLPGEFLLRLEPAALGELANRLSGGVTVISATNGKTTTAAMAAAVLERAGHELVYNRAGANMAGGVAAALLAATRARGRMDGDTGLFEVDEFWLGAVCDQLRPGSLLLANLFRDQLDRYGELEMIADRWAEVVRALPAASALVLNADDPLVADLGRERANTTYFGVDDAAVALPEMQHAADSKHCRRCGSPYRYDVVYMGHLGDYHCPGCGQARPRPAVQARAITLHGTSAASFTLVSGSLSQAVTIPLPGLYNVYNALAATALCLALGVPLELIADGLEHTAAAFGRAETVTLGERTILIMLVKNPAGANEILRTLVLEDEQLDVLAVLNDNTADGRDVSWIWDADFELLGPRLRSITCAGTRAAELAVRLKYAGVPAAAISVIPAVARALDHALTQSRGARLFALPTYTAMLALREELVRRGASTPYWQLER